MKFLRQEAHFKKRISLNWRKPKGRHSKLREKRRGLHKMPNIGFSKGKIKEIPIIHNLSELNKLKKGEKAILSSKVGNKKRIIILEEAIKRQIIIKNYKNPDKIKMLKENYEERIKTKPKEKPKIVKENISQKPKKKVVVKKKSEVNNK